MSCVIDLVSRRVLPTSSMNLVHPAGLKLPLDCRLGEALIAPEFRAGICAGTYGREMIANLLEVLREGDRVLVVGAGLGILSTLAAKSPGVEQVIAVEADVRLIPYLQSVHALNGVSWVQTLNAAPAEKCAGRVPFFARRDPRTSSLKPDDGDWEQVMMVPVVDLGLILSDEQINLIVWDTPACAEQIQMLAEADLSLVDRVLINCGRHPPASRLDPETASSLARQGFAISDCGGALVLGHGQCGDAHASRFALASA